MSQPTSIIHLSRFELFHMAFFCSLEGSNSWMRRKLSSLRLLMSQLSCIQVYTLPCHKHQPLCAVIRRSSVQRKEFYTFQASTVLSGSIILERSQASLQLISPKLNNPQKNCPFKTLPINHVPQSMILSFPQSYETHENKQKLLHTNSVSTSGRRHLRGPSLQQSHLPAFCKLPLVLCPWWPIK